MNPITQRTNKITNTVERNAKIAAGAALLAADKVAEKVREMVDSGEQLISDTNARMKDVIDRTQERIDEGVDEAIDKADDLNDKVNETLSSSSTDRRPYEERTVDELYQLAAERDIAGRSEMNKDELIHALRS